MFIGIQLAVSTPCLADWLTACAIAGGKGPLAQLGIPLGQPLNKEIAGAALFLWIGFFAVAAVGAGNLGQQTGNEDVY